MLRIAAVGDLHVSEDDGGTYRPAWRRLANHADLLLLAGDLTRFGTARQAVTLAAELEWVRRPIVAVLGNHDRDAGEPERVRSVLEDVGVVVLEDKTVTLRIRGQSVGVAGCKGFGGGFGRDAGRHSSDPAVRRGMGLTERSAEALRRNLALLRTDLRIALTHYAPVANTLQGEDPDVWRFLGSELLGAAIDRAGADLAVHGHSHKGRETGCTPGGVAVRNVALPVIGRPYAVYDVVPRGAVEPVG